MTGMGFDAVFTSQDKTTMALFALNDTTNQSFIIISIIGCQTTVKRALARNIYETLALAKRLHNELPIKNEVIRRPKYFSNIFHRDVG